MNVHQASDPAFVDRVRDSFSRQAFMTTIGARLARVEPGLVEIQLECRDDLTQQHGFLHGGVAGAIADSAGGYAGYTLFPAGSSVLTVEYKLNLVAPAKGQHLVAIGEVLKFGKTLTITDLKVYAVDGENSTLCATGQQTLMCLHDRSGQASRIVNPII